MFPPAKLQLLCKNSKFFLPKKCKTYPCFDINQVSRPKRKTPTSPSHPPAHHIAILTPGTSHPPPTTAHSTAILTPAHHIAIPPTNLKICKNRHKMLSVISVFSFNLNTPPKSWKGTGLDLVLLYILYIIYIIILLNTTQHLFFPLRSPAGTFVLSHPCAKKLKTEN